MNEYEKLRSWLSSQAEKKGKTTLMRFLDAKKTTFFRVLSEENSSAPSADTFLEWMERMGVRFVLPDEKLENFELIPKVEAEAGAGSSFLTSDRVLGYYAFRTDFLYRVGIKAKDSVMMSVIGHSMEPLIRHQDTILVDQSVKDLRDGEIFLVSLGDELLVKRVQRTPRGWLLKSENKGFSDMPVEGPDLENFCVYGRVRWFGRVL